MHSDIFKEGETELIVTFNGLIWLFYFIINVHFVSGI